MFKFIWTVRKFQSEKSDDSNLLLVFTFCWLHIRQSYTHTYRATYKIIDAVSERMPFHFRYESNKLKAIQTYLYLNEVASISLMN